MLERVHQHIVDELQQSARTDTIFVVTAVIFNLVVLGINSEQPAVARGFVEENGYTFRTLSDLSREVSAAYEVRGIPTVFVIDREGQIVEHYVGARSEADLRSALKKAGIR